MSFAYLGGGMFNVIDTLGLVASSVTVVMFGSPLSTLVRFIAAILLLSPHPLLFKTVFQ